MKNETVTFFGKKYRVSTLSKHGGRAPLRLYGGLYGGLAWNAYSECTCGLMANGATPQEAVTKLEEETLKEFRKLAKVCGYEVSE